jgi:hypothetical protein
MRKESFTVDEINLPEDVLGSTVRICVVQLRTPFWSEAVPVPEAIPPIFIFPKELPHNHYYQRLKRLKSLLDDLPTGDASPNIVLFPEYSFAQTMIEDLGLHEYCIRRNTIIVGNYYDANRRESVSFTAYPDPINHKTKIIESPKQNPSTHDAQYLTSQDKMPENRRKLFRLWWKATVDGRRKDKAFIQVFTCLDFDNFARSDTIDINGKQVVDVENNGIILVPCCTPKGIDEWHGKAKNLFRDAAYHRKTLITVFANNCSTPQTTGLTMCGDSQIVVFDPEMVERMKIPYRREGVIIALISPFTLELKTTPPSPNKIAIDGLVQYIDDSGNLTEASENIPRTTTPGATINPAVFEKISRRVFYLVFRLRDYYAHKKKLLESHQFASHGIFGVHDVMCRSVEEEGDPIDESSYIFLRLSQIDSIRDDVVWPYFMKVKRYIKSRGTPLWHADGGGDLVPCYPVSREIKINDYLEDVRSIMTHHPPSHPLSELLSQNVCIPVSLGLELSDVSEQERTDSKFQEFLILLNISENSALFEKYVLLDLVSEDDVRTIEEISDSTKGGGRGYEVEVHYMLHLVGSVRALRHIVIDLIHKKCAEYSIMISTRVILPAEQLSRDGSMSLFETIPDRREDRDVVKDCVTKFCDSKYDDPFCIRRLNPSELADLTDIYRKSMYLVPTYPLPQEKRLVKNRRYEFIYGMGSILARHNNDFDRGEMSNDQMILRRMCKSLFDDIVNRVEVIFTRNSRKKAQEVGESDFIHLINSFQIATQKPNKVKIFQLDDLKRQSVLGNHLQMLRYWNAALQSKEKLTSNDNKTASILLAIQEKEIQPVPQEFVSRMSAVQKANLIMIRNWFAHVQDDETTFMDDSKTEGEDIFKIDSREKVVNVLKAALVALDFVHDFYPGGQESRLVTD